MTLFEAGFLKNAEECGMSEAQASRLLKSALEHPEAVEMFKDLPDEQVSSAEEGDGLVNSLLQEIRHHNMGDVRKKLQAI